MNIRLDLNGKPALDGKVALITGGSRGIGQAIAATYAACGARVVISSRKLDGLERAADEIRAQVPDAQVVPYAAHAGDPQAAHDCVAFAVQTFGTLDILVNNAATNPHFGNVIDVDVPRFDKTVEVNLRGPLVWTQEAWRQAMHPESAHPGGCVINLSSVSGLQFNDPLGVYGTTKAALIHQTKHLAGELAPAVRVNAIAPGLVKTEFARMLWEGAAPDAKYPWALERIGEPQDIANAALFLASDLASWITGEVLIVDGGAMIKGGI